jgi:RHH-type proline utilization regulon transcriptional repressor/proline dehydrogenase/delta 1-pyrroline-5-carboxylate dehydrogenase
MLPLPLKKTTDRAGFPDHQDDARRGIALTWLMLTGGSAMSNADRHLIHAALRAREADSVSALIGTAALSPDDRAAISKDAAGLVRAVRGSAVPGVMEQFLGEYGLSTREGVALMCLAEALLRVPDSETVDALIEDKIAPHDWGAHLGDSGSILVNASTWALMLTGRVLEEEGDGVVGALRGLVRRLGEPVIRTAVGRAMREMGAQFVLGRDIAEAMKRGAGLTDKGYTYSFDMLGEAARTEADALRYHRAYADAIRAIAARTKGDDIRANPGISVKLSALHPRYEYAKGETTTPVLAARLLELAKAAKAGSIGLNVDAEEVDRLDPSLDVIEAVLGDASLAGWDGFGVVVQAYGPRAAPVIDWLYALAGRLGRRIMVRLVKGAYWDAEIKRAQVQGVDRYPVFTRKTHTDISYIACARKLLGMRDRIYPQFATHNAHSAAAILHMAGSDRAGFEFQRLHGMGEALHETLRVRERTRCRIYAPVGAHRDLLAYLVRRLLENGANSSFVHQIVDEDVSPETIAADPFATIPDTGPAPHPRIPPPPRLYGASRRNAAGWDIADPLDLADISAARAPFAAPHRWRATPLTAAQGDGPSVTIRNPANPDDIVGEVREASVAQAAAAIGVGAAAQPQWAATPVTERAKILRAIADSYEAHAGEFFALAAREAGKTLADAVAEVREAVDFLRYYAAEAPSAEAGTQARGVIVCISPWNFPLAIFTGQVAAALVSGNAVIAKPAEQTPLIAHLAVRLMHAAGAPEDVLHLLPGEGESVGAALVGDPRIAGVCFTGSTTVAKIIDRQLARSAPGAMLIAETGGLNAMLVDSTALPEQAVRDILAGAFQSAGQRCSALRVLYVQRDVADGLLEMLSGAMDTLEIGDPWRLPTDVGPVIDDAAQAQIAAYIDRCAAEGRVIKRLEAPAHGRFIAPSVIRVRGIADMKSEIFGPVLHVATFEGDEVARVANDINASGYGLTFGLHTRIDGRVQEIVERIHAGNIYVNRNQIGAIVGAQPFGGEGLSGTGPKAGGPHYLRRFRRADAPEPATAGGSGPDMSRDALRAAAAAVPAPAPRAPRDAIAPLRAALRGRAAAAVAAAAATDVGPVDLPGPTGEANQMFLAPRGLVLCLGPDPSALLDQAVKALATGNRVLAVAPSAQETLAPLIAAGLPLGALDGTASPGAAAAIGAAAIAHDGPEDARVALRRALADADGPIAPLLTRADPVAAFAVERAVSVDTTAAGGDAALLAAAG